MSITENVGTVARSSTTSDVFNALAEPHDWAAGRDPQLDTAVRLALQAMEQRTPAAPPAAPPAV